MSNLIRLPGQEMIPEAKAFRDSLRLDEQEAFDALYVAALENYHAMESSGLVIPFEKMLFAMLIEQQKQIQALQGLIDQSTHTS